MANYGDTNASTDPTLVEWMFVVREGGDYLISDYIGNYSTNAAAIFNGLHGGIWELPAMVMTYGVSLDNGYSNSEALTIAGAATAGGILGTGWSVSLFGKAALGIATKALFVTGTGFAVSLVVEIITKAAINWAGDTSPLGPSIPAGTVSSANMPGQYGNVLQGFETNALDVMGDTNPFRFSSQGQTETSGLSEASRAAYTDKIRAQTEYIDAVNTDYSSNIASNVSVSDLVRNSSNNSSTSDPHAGHNHSSTVGQNNSQLDRGLDALNTLGSGIDLDAIDNTSTIVFDPKIADPDSGGLGGRGDGFIVQYNKTHQNNFPMAV